MLSSKWTDMGIFPCSIKVNLELNKEANISISSFVHEQ